MCVWGGGGGSIACVVGVGRCLLGGYPSDREIRKVVGEGLGQRSDGKTKIRRSNIE